MILIGLGSNLSGEEFDSPRAVLAAALKAISGAGIEIKKLSRFYESEPVPKSDQPWFVNAVAAVETGLPVGELLNKLHEIEHRLGRERRVRWAARIIDLDILAFDDVILPSAARWQAMAGDNITPNEIIIPHPRMHERLFVLKPLMDICPDWTHPVLGKTAAEFVIAVEKEADQSLQTSI